MTQFTDLLDLASERLGGSVLHANDEFFAPKENLLRAKPAVWLEHEYTDRGKWMDGWETRRKRVPGYDWCIVRLGLPGILRGLVVDTAFFRGNYPSHCSVDACYLPGAPHLDRLLDPATAWVEILPKSSLQGDSKNLFPLESPYRFSHLRLNIYPDGGVARFRVHGEVLLDSLQPGAAGAEIDLAAAENGAQALSCSDMFFSSRHNLILPGRGFNMSDGWETRRRRGPGHDWVTLRLAAAGVVRRVEVDTTHFKGNYPDTCSLEGWPESVPASEDPGPGEAWIELLPRQKLEAHTRHLFVNELSGAAAISHVRFNVYPDGGVSRLRLWGVPSDEGAREAGIRALNALLPDAAAAALGKCCGSQAWARKMAQLRPYKDPAALQEAADSVWWSLGAEAWLEAFSAHPKIGERHAAREQTPEERRWSESEQAGAGNAVEATRTRLAEANRAYEERFGHIFIVCATGKSAEEMLQLLAQRLSNPKDTELRVAAEEQRRITSLRLERLLRP